MEITKDDFVRWKSDHVTIEVFGNVLQFRMDKIARQLARGGALVETESKVLVGRYLEIEDLMEMKFEDMLKGE